MKHSIHRTSPKGQGQKFIGTCANCGMPNLPDSAAMDDCPNQRGVTQDQSLLEAIAGEDISGMHWPDPEPADLDLAAKAIVEQDIPAMTAIYKSLKSYVSYPAAKIGAGVARKRPGLFHEES